MQLSARGNHSAENTGFFNSAPSTTAAPTTVEMQGAIIDDDPDDKNKKEMDKNKNPTSYRNRGFPVLGNGIDRSPF